MAPEETAWTQQANAANLTERSSLEPRDVERLTNFKVRYALESRGFTAAQAQRLLFYKWLRARGGLGG